MLLESLNLKPGQWFIQNTANGAVGKTLAILARARGIPMINLVRRDTAVEELNALGIANGVSTESKGWKERVRTLTGDAPLVVAVDSIGGDASGDLFGLLGEQGMLVSFGAMSNEPMRLNSGDAIFKQASVKGFWAKTVLETASSADKTRMIGELLRLALSGDLRWPVASIFDIADVAKAAAASDNPGRNGKILLRF